MQSTQLRQGRQVMNCPIRCSGMEKTCRNEVIYRRIEVYLSRYCEKGSRTRMNDSKCSLMAAPPTCCDFFFFLTQSRISSVVVLSGNVYENVLHSLGKLVHFTISNPK